MAGRAVILRINIKNYFNLLVSNIANNTNDLEIGFIIDNIKDLAY